MQAINSAIRSAISAGVSIGGEGGVPTLNEQFAAFMASLAAQKVLHDPSRSTTRFQDGAGSTLVTANGQPFARLNDSSGTSNHVRQTVAASMPLYGTDGVLHWAEFDGSNDSWQSIANLDLTGTDKLTMIIGMTKLSDAVGMVIESSSTSDSNPGTFAYLIGNSGANTTARLRGSTPFTGQIFTTPAAPYTSVDTISFDLAQATSQTEIIVRSNGVLKATTRVEATDAGSGNFGSYPLYMCRRAEAALPARIRLYGFLLIGRLLTVDERTLCERWMASRTGVTL